MTGILNHPKMPVVAGSLALALLAGGVYSSIDQGVPGTSTVKKVAAAVQSTVKPASAVTDTHVPAPAAPALEVSQADVSTKGPSRSSSVIVTGTDLAASVQQPAGGPAPAISSSVSPVVPVQPVQPVTPVEAPRSPTTSAAAATKPNPTQSAPSAPAPNLPAQHLIVEPIMPATPAAAPVTPVKVSVPAVAKVVVPDATQPTLPAAAASAPAVSPAVAPVIPVATRSTPAVASFKKQHPVERAHKKKHHATNHEDDDGGNGAEQSQPVKTVQPQHNATDSSDYTEIKGMGSSQTLVAAVQASATAPAPSRVVTDDGFKPAIVATAGGKAWVKISPARTIAVKSGDSVPGLGKVESVTDSAVVTEKGKFSVNTKE